MTTRMTPRQIQREELQELLHEAFRLTQALEAELAFANRTPAPDRQRNVDWGRVDSAMAELNAIQEQLRARIIPLFA